MDVPEYLIKAIIRHYETLVRYHETENVDKKLKVNAYNARRLAKQEIKTLQNILKKNTDRHGH